MEVVVVELVVVTAAVVDEVVLDVVLMVLGVDRVNWALDVEVDR